MTWFDRPPEETSKTYKLRNGVRMTIHTIPPHGHWKIKWSKGPVPPELSGAYLSHSDAYKHAEQYLKTRDHKTAIVEEVNAA